MWLGTPVATDPLHFRVHTLRGDDGDVAADRAGGAVIVYRNDEYGLRRSHGALDLTTVTVSGAELAAILEGRGLRLLRGVPCSLIEDLIATLEAHPRLP